METPKLPKVRAPWSDVERQAWAPPERLTVSECADKYRVLGPSETSRPGPWRTDRVPYLREMMDAFSAPNITKMVGVTGSQVGKTECLLTQMHWVAYSDPAPCMVVYPTVELGDSISQDRIQPMFQKSRVLASRYIERKSQRAMIRFNGGFLCISGANSAASLSSKPIKYLWMDETDKFPPFIGKEGSPISLAEERQKSFPRGKKEVLSSTPTIVDNPIWSAWSTVEMQRHYEVPCPHCGLFIRLEFPQVKWPKDLSDELKAVKQDRNLKAQVIARIKRETWYECPACRKRIHDGQKFEMLAKGRWTGSFEGVASVGFHLNSLYSPTLSFGDVAAQFLTWKDAPEDLRTFINGWLAEPWKDKVDTPDEDRIRGIEDPTYERGSVPNPHDVLALTAGVDCQESEFWWSVRAWGYDLKSWLVDYGVASELDQIEQRFTKGYWEDRLGYRHRVRLCLVDSGYRPERVYPFCSRNPDMFMPSKGSSHPMNGRTYSVTKLDASKLAVNMNLCIVDTDYWKDFISGRMSNGTYRTFSPLPHDYMVHMTSEQKVEQVDRRTGKSITTWVPKESHPANHLFDCEVYSACAAEILGLRYAVREGIERPKNAVVDEDDDDNWALKGRSW